VDGVRLIGVTRVECVSDQVVLADGQGHLLEADHLGVGAREGVDDER